MLNTGKVSAMVKNGPNPDKPFRFALLQTEKPFENCTIIDHDNGVTNLRTNKTRSTS